MKPHPDPLWSLSDWMTYLPAYALVSSICLWLAICHFHQPKNRLSRLLWLAQKTPGLWQNWMDKAAELDFCDWRFNQQGTPCYTPTNAWTPQGYQTVYVEDEMWDGWRPGRYV